MIEISITPKVLLQAQELAAKLGILKKSFTNGRGNLCGFVGQIIVKSYLGGEGRSSFDYDFLIGDKKIEVKSKLTSVVPLPHYDCSVTDYYEQKCDYYVFVRVKSDYSVAWILGYKKASDVKKCQFVKKGDFDPSNNFRVKMDSYIIPIKDLEKDFEVLCK